MFWYAVIGVLSGITNYYLLKYYEGLFLTMDDDETYQDLIKNKKVLIGICAGLLWPMLVVFYIRSLLNNK